MGQHTARVETWDRVSESYLEEITDSEEEIGKQLADRMFRLCPDAETISALELGSGSGHLSAVLAECGIQTALLDFSEKALERAKKVYDEHGLEGTWICQDLFDLDIQGSFDIAWNSGVMEHFTDQEFDQLIENFKKLNVKYFILIVPNAESIPYLLYRYYMEVQNEWIWGREFLRTDYVQRMEQAGFKTQDCFYIGSKYTEYTLNEALKRKFPYSEWVQCHMAAEYNHSLAGYVFTFGQSKTDVIKPDSFVSNSVELKTKILELRSRLDYASDVTYALSRQKENLEQELQELEQKIKELEQKIKELEHNYDHIQAELKNTQEAFSACKEELAEKSKLLKELAEKNKLLKELTEKKKKSLCFFTR